MIEPQHPTLSIVRQCALVSLSRSGFYYQPSGESPQRSPHFILYYYYISRHYDFDLFQET